MSSWTARARVHFLQEGLNSAPITPKPPLLGVMGVVSGGKLEKSHSDFAANEPSQAVPAASAVNWRELDQAYQAHHWTCHACQAAGRGQQYGQRCAMGLALWVSYSETT